MDKAIYLVSNGAKVSFNAQQIHANNLANSKTPGFRADIQDLDSVKIYGDTFPTRVYSNINKTQINFDPGALQQTQRDLDVAIADKGFFAVIKDDGTEAYTRRGDLQIDVNGNLVNGQNLLIANNGGAPIATNNAARLDIANDGSINFYDSEDNLIGQSKLKLVNPANVHELSKGGDGLLYPANGEVLEPDLSVRVQSGFVENSNVNPIAEMVHMIDIARNFEMQMKIMSNLSNDSAKASELIGPA